MGLLYKFFRWVFRFFDLVAPLAPLLWGVSIYSSMAYLLWVIVSQTASMIQGLGASFNGWAENFSGLIVGMFEEVQGNSYFSFFSYILSLDVPLEWFRSVVTVIIGDWLTYIVGAGIGIIEIALFVLGIYFVRSRLKALASGFGSGGEGGNV